MKWQERFFVIIFIFAIAGYGSAQNTESPSGVLSAGSRLPTPTQAGTYVASNYDWERTDSSGSIGNLAAAGAGKTLTLIPCPAGVDVTHSANAPYAIYISGTGKAEAVPVTGGTCKSGAASGTIVVTTRHAHPSGFTVRSANGGNQEAINVASSSLGGSYAVIQEVPAGATKANYNIYWPVFFNLSQATLVGDGAFWQCFTRSICLMTTNWAKTGQGHNVIRGLTMQPAVNQDGVQVVSASASNGVYTVTTAGNHNLQAGDWVILSFSTPAADQESRVQALSTGLTATQFQYCNNIVSYNPTVCTGSGPSFATSNGYGWVALEDAAIEVESDGTKLADLRFQAPAVAGAKFHHGVVVGDDEDFVVDGMTVLSGQVFRADANFVGEVLYFRGDNGAAGVPYIHHLEASMQCGGNGIRALSGNTLHVMDSVIQGVSQYAIYYGPGMNPWEVDNVYNENGSCGNPFYTGGKFTAQVSYINNSAQPFTLTGNAPVGGAFPMFASGGGAASQRNYYVVGHDASKGYTVPLFFGIAQPASSGTSIPLYWPNLDLNGTSGVTWDILVTLGQSPATAPYTGNAFAVATGITASCTNAGVCTYTDTQGATTPYTMQIPNWVPSIGFWPGSVVLARGSALYEDLAAQGGGGVIATTTMPSVFAKRCSGTGFHYWYSSTWEVCPGGDSVGNANPTVGAQLMQLSGSTNMASGVTGTLNFAPSPFASVSPRQIVTFLDGIPAQTLATPGYVRAGNAKDSFIGTDSKGRIGTQDQTYGAPGGHNFYVNDKGTSGKTWALHIGASGPQVKKSTYSELNAATPCSSNTEGSIAAVTDSNTSTWGATIAGGGSSHVLAYCDGAHWTVMAD